MAYVIIELQTDANGNTATPPLVTKKDRNEALQAFLATASVAAVSNVPIHTVIVMTETGEKLRNPEVFIHTQEVGE